MMMRFRGGGVGHVSTRVATDVFKQDRDDLDIESCRARQKQCAPPNVEEEEGMDTDLEGSELEAGEADEELEDNELSESELADYGYERDGEDSEDSEDSDDRDVGEEDDNTIDELGALGYADY
jgi:hypothetical protein